MDRGRILILGNTKDSTYEIRNLFDNQRYELEIALTPEVGKQVLTTRRMHLILIHTEMLTGENLGFLQFLSDRAIDVPVVILGDQAEQYERAVPEVRCFQKPFALGDLLQYIRNL